MKGLVVLKAGGSVCTEKKKNRAKARKAVIKRMVREIKEAKKKKKFDLVLVHGAGPYGHSMVKKYGINNGVKNAKRAEGFVKTVNSCRKLNGVFVDEMEKQGMLPFPIMPATIAAQKNKKTKSFDIRLIKGLLGMKKGIIPLLYGDMVLDERLGASVISGDRIAAEIAKRLKPEKFLLGTDVEGVKDRKGRVLKEINRKNFNPVLENAKGSRAVDVTGGMRGKLTELKKTLKGTDAVIFNLEKKGNLEKLLTGKTLGTRVKL